jgi:isopenicillin N synthase-like dioxygenase
MVNLVTADLVAEDDVGLYADFDNRFSTHDDRFGIDREAITSLPVIDISPLFDGGDAGARARVGQAIRDACINIGFFHITGHGIAQSELDELVDWVHRFFSLPVDDKNRLHKDHSPRKFGYMPIGGLTPDANPDHAADLKENFNMPREPLSGEPESQARIIGDPQWPGPGLLPGFEEFMKAHIQRVGITHALARGFSLSLGLEDNYFGASHRYHGGTCLLNYYPSLTPDKMNRTQWSSSPHSDYGSFTLLSQDSLSGLQVRNAAGHWIDVPPISDTFIVNIGELFAVWTNDLYTPSLHRAINTSGKARVSVPYFVNAQGDTIVQCLETCQGPDNPPLFAPVSAGDHSRALVEQSFRTGRPGVSVRTAQQLKKGSGAPL